MEFNRLSCFISYCEAYRPAMERVKHLLEMLEFEVSVFDGPDHRPAPEVVHSEIQKADLVVVLLGPDFRLAGQDDERAAEPAAWPYEEALFALGQNKPIALILHPRTRVPSLLAAYQTPAQFDFRDETSYANHVHHVVKHLLDSKRTFDLPAGDLPYYYQRVSFRYRVDRKGYIAHDVYHQVVARQPWSVLHHSIDLLDRTETARITVLNRDSAELAATMGSTGHSLEIIWGAATQHEQAYVVTFSPPIPPGGQIGYRRMFELDNFFPLTASSLRDRADEPGFPSVFQHGGRQYYGKSFEIRSEMESLSAAFQFPATVDVRSCRAVAMVDQVHEVNERETTRINAADVLTMTRSEESGDSAIALHVDRPLAGHRYLLLYEPGK